MIWWFWVSVWLPCCLVNSTARRLIHISDFRNSSGREGGISSTESAEEKGRGEHAMIDQSTSGPHLPCSPTIGLISPNSFNFVWAAHCDDVLVGESSICFATIPLWTRVISNTYCCCKAPHNWESYGGNISAISSTSLKVRINAKAGLWCWLVS